MSLSCVTGRFQPPHRQHLDLLLLALRRADRLVVAVTNPDTADRARAPESGHRHLAEANPFTFYERLRLVTAALCAAGVRRERFDVVPFPLTAPALWPHYVPLAATHLVRVFSPWERAKAERLRAGGYDVVVLDGVSDQRLAGSDIRAAMVAGRPWREHVPEPVADLVEQMLRERTLDERLGG